MLTIHIRTDDQMTNEVNEALKTKFKQLWWLMVTDDNFIEDSDDFYAFEDEITERFGVDYLSLAIKHHSNVEHCLTSTYPHDENYFDSLKYAQSCAKELIKLLSKTYNCNQNVFIDD